MPWFFWVLLWVVLGLIFLLSLVLGAIFLWRRAKALLAEAGRAQEELSAAYSSDAAALSAPASAKSALPVGWDAAFGDPALVRAVRDEERDGRVAARRERRIASLHAHGRPRRWEDLPQNSPEPEKGTTGPVA